MTTHNKDKVIDISKHLNEVRSNKNRREAKGSFAKSNCSSLSPRVRQYDFIINDRGSGSDEEGDRMFYAADTDNLMIGADVRVLVKSDAALEDVIRALLKITQWVVSIQKYKKETEEFDLPF